MGRIEAEAEARQLMPVQRTPSRFRRALGKLVNSKLVFRKYSSNLGRRFKPRSNRAMVTPIRCRQCGGPTGTIGIPLGDGETGGIRDRVTVGGATAVGITGITGPIGEIFRR